MTPQTSRVITIKCGGPGLVVPNKNTLRNRGVKFITFDNRSNCMSPRECYQYNTENYTEDVLIFTHDDVTIHDPDWHDRLVNSLFGDNDIVAAGFGGATGLGVKDLYKKPYKLDDMARQNYYSNQTDGYVHGWFAAGIMPVAVLDAFVMAVSRKFIMSIGGWPDQLTHHCLDLWLACEIARAKKQCYMTGVSCTHHGGGTSIKPIYANAKWLQGGTLDRDHQSPHEWIYSTYRDVLPILVPQS